MPIPGRTGISSGVPLGKDQELPWCLSRKDWDLLCCPHSRHRDVWHWAVGAAGHLCFPSGPSHAPGTLVPPHSGQSHRTPAPLVPPLSWECSWGRNIRGWGLIWGPQPSFSPLLLGYSQPSPCGLHHDEVPHLQAEYPKDFPDPAVSEGGSAVPQSL